MKIKQKLEKMASDCDAVDVAFERFYAIAEKYDVDASVVLGISKTFFEGMKEHSISASDYVKHVGATGIEADVAEVCDDLADMIYGTEKRDDV